MSSVDRRSALRRLTTAFVLLGLMIGAYLLPEGCSEPPPIPKAKNIVVLVLDTLRADHLSLYGYPRPVSPNLDRFAQSATVFNRAFATASWTLPSHASLFTGLYPSEHGAHSVWVDLPENADTKTKKLGLEDNVRPLAKTFPTLAERLRDLGFQTAAIGANAVFLAPRFGLQRGFEHYDIKRAHSGEINARTFGWLAQNHSKPFFLFVNYMDTHRPYNTMLGRARFGRKIPADSERVLRRLYNQIMLEESPPSAALLSTAINQYDLALSTLDADLGRLFEKLTELGIYEESLVVVTSDHGEFFGEHGLIEHSKDLYQEALWIPLLIKYPGQHSGRLEERIISLAHLQGLILKYTRDSTDQLTPNPWPHEIVFAENHFTRLRDLLGPARARFLRSRRAIFRDRWKYVRSSDSQHELYDLSREPTEESNLLLEKPGIAEELFELLETEGPAAPRLYDDFESHQLTDQEMEALRALGYL